MRLLLFALILVAGCGSDIFEPPPGASSVSISNQQGESLFTVRYTDGMETVTAIDGARVDGFAIDIFADVIKLDYGTPTMITVEVTTLGDVAMFEFETTTEPGTLELVHDFDFALGRPRVRFSW